MYCDGSQISQGGVTRTCMGPTAAWAHCRMAPQLLHGPTAVAWARCNTCMCPLPHGPAVACLWKSGGLVRLGGIAIWPGVHSSWRVHVIETSRLCELTVGLWRHAPEGERKANMTMAGIRNRVIPSSRISREAPHAYLLQVLTCDRLPLVHRTVTALP